MLDIIDEINNSNLPTNSILVGFDIVNMFPSIDNKSGLKSVHDILELRDSKFPPTSCVIEAFELCLSCNNSTFNNTNYLQTDGTAQRPHMSYFYADLALASYDSKVLAFFLSPKTWKRFRDDVPVVWTHRPASVSLVLEYLNYIYKTGKIQFTMQATADDEWEFLDLKLKMVNGKIGVDVFSKPTSNFTYVFPSTYLPKRNKKSQGIALRLRTICDSDEKYDKRQPEIIDLGL